MGAPLKLLSILVIQLVASAIFSYFNFKFLFSRIKSGVYEVPLLGSFDVWWKFIIAAWVFNIPFYVVGTLLVALSYKISLENFGTLYTAFIVSNVCGILMSVFFIHLTAGEVPNKNGWIAIVLVLASLLFAAYSGKDA